VLRPELLAEWHPDRNERLDPFAIGPGSSLKVWWRCQACGHEWQTRPSHRCEGRGCPSCSRRHIPRERSLGALRPELLADWHPDRNEDLDPFTVAPHSGRVWIWWRCRYCGHEWQTTPLGRGHSKGGCRSCAPRRGPITQHELAA
jgi:rubrerythrin